MRARGQGILASEIMSFGHDERIELMNSQQLRLLSQDLHEIREVFNMMGMGHLSSHS